MASHQRVILRAHFMRLPTFFLKLCKKILDMTTHSYTMYTDLKEGLLHPAVTTVLWIVCMKIIQKRHAVLHE